MQAGLKQYLPRHILTHLKINYGKYLCSTCIPLPPIKYVYTLHRKRSTRIKHDKTINNKKAISGHIRSVETDECR